jgi:hypothetical protein
MLRRGTELARTGALIWIGALTVLQDEMKDGFARLTTRGEKAEAEGRLAFESWRRQERPSSAPRRRGPSEWLLGRLGRPTRRETRALRLEIERLEARVASLS